MTDRDRETLERFLADHIWIPAKLEPAIRSLLERLEAAEKEVEQLRNLCDIAGREEQFAIDEEEKLQARIEAALALHTEWGIFDECGHDHTQEDLDAGRCLDIPEVGLTCEEGKVQSVCRECHTDDGEPSEDTFEGEWPCPTHKALTGEGE